MEEGICRLPDEILVLCLSWLTPEEAGPVAKVSRRLRRLCRAPCVWRERALALVPGAHAHVRRRGDIHPLAANGSLAFLDLRFNNVGSQGVRALAAAGWDTSHALYIRWL